MTDVNVAEATENTAEVTATAVVEAPAPRNAYKKTDRVRKAKLHEKLEAQLRTTERALVGLGVANAEVTLERNNDPSAARYARAIFDVTFVAGDKRIPIRGKTAEEVLAIARGVRLVADLLK